MSETNSGRGRGRRVEVEAKQGGAAGLAGYERQALTLRLMTKLWQRFHATAKRELGVEPMLRSHATSQSTIGGAGGAAHPLVKGQPERRESPDR